MFAFVLPYSEIKGFSNRLQSKELHPATTQNCNTLRIAQNQPTQNLEQKILFSSIGAFLWQCMLYEQKPNFKY